MSNNSNGDIPAYVTVVMRQETTDGNQCYVAYHPELPNCMGQGDTPAEATESLSEATEMVIEHLRANGLPVPAPQNQLSFQATGSGSASLPLIQQVTTIPSIHTPVQRASA